MAGVNRVLSGELAQTKLRGKAFVKELGKVFSPGNIAKTQPKTQSMKAGRKK